MERPGGCQVNVYPLKCRIRAEAAVTGVDVYDDMGEGGWSSDGLTAKSFAAQLAGVKGALEVHINSGGGDVFDGIAIGNAIRGHTGPVTTVTDGVAASIASVIAQAGGDGKRIIEPGAMMMIHDAFGLCQGDAADMGKMAQRLGDVKDRKSTRLNSSHQIISYAVFCLKKKNKRLNILDSGPV